MKSRDTTIALLIVAILLAGWKTGRIQNLIGAALGK